MLKLLIGGGEGPSPTQPRWRSSSAAEFATLGGWRCADPGSSGLSKNLAAADRDLGGRFAGESGVRLAAVSMRCQETGDQIASHWWAEIEPLQFVTIQIQQPIALAAGFNAFRDHPQPDAMRHLDYRVDNRRAVPELAVDEGTVQFDGIGGQSSQVAEGVRPCVAAGSDGGRRVPHRESGRLR